MRIWSLIVRRRIEIFFSPYVISLIPAIIIILLLPPVFAKYRVSLTHSGFAHKPNSIEKYTDLDEDGLSERIVVFLNKIGNPALKVLTNDNIDIEQWNFYGAFPDQQDFVVEFDLDKDGFKEIYIFTVSNDTLFLNALEPIPNRLEIFRKKFITLINKEADAIHVIIENCAAADLNGDDFDELIFNVEAGFSKQPRAIFAYDIRNDSFWQSLSYGANVANLIIDDINGDKQPEVLCACVTLGNIHDSLNIPFSDYSSYLMAFNNRLELLFDPIPYSVYPSAASIALLKVGNEKQVALYFNNLSTDSALSYMSVINPEGKILRYKTFKKDSSLLGGNAQILNISFGGLDKSFVLIGKNGVFIFDELLNLQTHIDDLQIIHFIVAYDLDGDGKKEMLFWNPDHELVITQHDFTDPLTIESGYNPLSSLQYCVSIKDNAPNPPEIFIKTGYDQIFYFTYKSNWLYYLRYPIWLAIYGSLLLLLLLIRHILKIQLERKMEIENRINALTLKTIKSQMDPHFMFNALNSISINILNKQPDIAYKYLVKYSQLLRKLFTKADKVAIPINEEFSFVEQYLELEQFRFKDRLSFSINIDADIDTNLQIPRMLIQLFVENAIKHGLSHKEGSGHIEIQATQKKDQIVIIVQDDGIGRQEALKYRDGSGMGLRIIDEMINLFEKVNGVIISYEIIDLDNKSPGKNGTRVEIFIPTDH